MGGLNNKSLFSHSSGGWEAKLKVLVMIDAFWLCPQVGFSLCVHILAVSSSLIRTSILLDQGLMPMTHVTLITSWKALKVLVTQLCLTLCDHMDCSPPGSSVHGILRARILEWIAISFFGVSSWLRDQTQVSCITGRFFTIWATREEKLYS